MSPAAAHINQTWLRPGSGSLQVELVTEGPVRVLRISDPQALEQPLQPMAMRMKAIEPLVPTSLKVCDHLHADETPKRPKHLVDKFGQRLHNCIEPTVADLT